MVARLIPDQKVGCSTHSVLTFSLFECTSLFSLSSFACFERAKSQWIENERHSPPIVFAPFSLDAPHSLLFIERSRRP